MIGDEKEIISLCIKGNYTAQKALYDKYSKLFYTICLRYCKDEDEAQDILQDAFIKIFKNLSQFKHEGSFEGWMKRIVVNTSIEYYRKKIHFLSIEDNENSEEMPMQIDNNNIDESILLGLIQALPNGFRMIFNMYVIEGYNHIEIAEKLGISEGTSKSQLSRARALLQKKIEELYKMNL
jgi:RNA polymerase sigma factor (sigma-70 family)